MNLVKQIHIKKNNSLYKECDRLCFAAKNLYNYALYQVNAEFKLSGKYLNYYDLNKRFIRENQVDYRALPSRLSNSVLMLLDKNFKSYFEALKAYKKNPTDFTGCPNPPKFKHKTKGRYVIGFEMGAISKTKLKEGVIKLSGSSIEFKTEVQNIVQVRIIPKKGLYVIEIVYKEQEPDLIQNENYAGIDIGLSNLAAIGFNNAKPVIINGRPLKSINQYYNKKLANLNSKLPFYIDKKDGKRKQRKKSNATQRLTNKRNNKVKSYLHKASREVVNQLIQNNTSKVVIGKNNGWKDEINLGKKTNQSFCSIPHAQFIQMITYKCQRVGVEVILTEESYTSKCSFFDNESICKHKNYKGRRIKRGLFKTSTGLLVNADCNGSYNILKKGIPNSFEVNGIEGLTVSPIIITPKM